MVRKQAARLIAKLNTVCTFRNFHFLYIFSLKNVDLTLGKLKYFM